MEPSSAPGWYPDPSRRYEFRYFNGQRWTADVSVRGQRFVESPDTFPGGPATAPHQQLPPFHPNQPFSPFPPNQPFHVGVTPRRPGRGFAITSFVLGIGAAATAWMPVVFVFAGIAAVVGLVFGIISLARRSPGKAFAVWGVVLAAVAIPLCAVGWHFTVEFIDELQDPGPHEAILTSCRFDDSEATARGTLRNLDDGYNDYTITVEFTVDDIDFSRTTSLRRVAPGSTQSFVVTAITVISSSSYDVECRIESVERPFP